MFNINRPRRICFNEWMNLAKQLSGQTDVSKDDMLHRMEQVVLSKDPMRAGSLDYNRVDALACDEGRPVSTPYADDYAAAECASGAYNSNDPTEV